MINGNDLVVCSCGVPMFYGTPDEVKAWLEEHKNDPLLKTAHIILGTTATQTSVQNHIK